MLYHGIEVQSRPNLIHAIAVAAREAFRAIVKTGHFVIRMEPGDGTRYEFFGVVSTLEDREGLMFGYLERGSYVFHLGGFAHWVYTQEKIAKNEHSARVIADFLNVMGEFHTGALTLNGTADWPGQRPVPPLADEDHHVYPGESPEDVPMPGNDEVTS